MVNVLVGSGNLVPLVVVDEKRTGTGVFALHVGFQAETVLLK